MTQVLADQISDLTGPGLALGVPELGDAGDRPTPAGTATRRGRGQRVEVVAGSDRIREDAGGSPLGVSATTPRRRAVAGRGSSRRRSRSRGPGALLEPDGVRPGGPGGRSDPARTHHLGRRRSLGRWISSLAGVLDRDGGRRLLMLDDYPCGPSGSLGRQLSRLLTQTTGLRVVITCTGPPALDLARLRATGQLAHVGPEALRLDQDEVEQLLARSGVLADPATRDRALQDRGLGVGCRSCGSGADGDRRRRTCSTSSTR